MAKNIVRVTVNSVVVPDGSGGFDFVVIGANPLIEDPAATLEIDKGIRDPNWFDFSKVTAGTPYNKNGIRGRLLSDATTVAQIETAVINQAKAQAGIP